MHYKTFFYNLVSSKGVDWINNFSDIFSVSVRTLSENLHAESAPGLPRANPHEGQAVEVRELWQQI